MGTRADLIFGNNHSITSRGPTEKLVTFLDLAWPHLTCVLQRQDCRTLWYGLTGRKKDLKKLTKYKKKEKKT